MQFSANLGFLWTDLALPDAIRAAAAHGFDAVEVHFPYETPSREVVSALDDTGLPLLSLNTRPGGQGEFGLAALPDRTDEARAAIAEAIAYAAETGAGWVHVMAGKPSCGQAADVQFIASVSHAVEAAQKRGLGVLIEPLNPVDVPGYYLTDFDQAARIARETGARIMLDCYHAAMNGLDPVDVYARHRDLVGHVQFAGHPGRGAPDTGALDYLAALPAIEAAGYAGFFGAEYRPGGPTEASLGWMARLRGTQS